jgi:N-acetylmuramoyl-L-alanine amidase
MSGIFVKDLADIVRGEGIQNVKEWDGWKSRSNASGGFSTLMGIVIHHTASPPSWHGDKDWNYTLTASNAPEYNIGIDPDGRVNILAAGGVNSSGKGGPVKLSTGTVPQSGANNRLIAISFGNAGDGSESWSRQMIDAGVAVVGGICKRFGWDTGAVTCHKEWCGPGTSTPGRKIDPYGSWIGGGDWGPMQGRIDQFRGRVFDYLCTTPPPTPTPTPPQTGDDTVIVILESQSNPKEFNALFFAEADAQGRSIEVQWSGSGDDPAVMERVATMDANFGPRRHVLLAGLKNNRLHPKHRPSDINDSLHTWTDADFAP